MTMTKIGEREMAPPKRRFLARWWPALSWMTAVGLSEIALKAVGL